MAKPFGDLAKDLGRIGRAYERAADLKARRVAFKAAENLIDDTRVDTSRALSNWKISIGDIDGLEIDPHFVGRKGSTAQASRAEAKRLAEKKIKTRKKGEVYLVNNTPYTVYIVKEEEVGEAVLDAILEVLYGGGGENG